LEHLLDWKLFNPPYALPLIFIRVWSARRSRARATQFSAVADKKRAVREHGLAVAVNSPQSQSIHKRRRAMDSPRTGNGNERGLSADSPHPC
jgi:hypothetical protein